MLSIKCWEYTPSWEWSCAFIMHLLLLLIAMLLFLQLSSPTWWGVLHRTSEKHRQRPTTWFLSCAKCKKHCSISTSPYLGLVSDLCIKIFYIQKPLKWNRMQINLCLCMCAYVSTCVCTCTCFTNDLHTFSWLLFGTVHGFAVYSMCDEVIYWLHQDSASGLWSIGPLPTAPLAWAGQRDTLVSYSALG